MTYLILFAITAQAGLTNQINQHAVTTLSAVGHPYLAPGVADRADYVLRLELYDSEPNEIYDEDEWFDDHSLPFPEPAVKPNETRAPLQTKYGQLCFLRNTAKWIVAVYETKYSRARSVGMHDTAYTYTLVALEKSDTGTTVSAVYDMSELFPNIHKLCWLNVTADYVYFNAAYNDFAELTNDSTGYLYCLDISNSTIVWATKNLVSSYYGFTICDDYILTGYGFTNEDDFLYVVDRYTGEIVQTIPIKTAHEHIIVRGRFCFVRTYNTNYIFSIVKAK